MIGYILVGALLTFAEWTFKGAAIASGFALAKKLFKF